MKRLCAWLARAELHLALGIAVSCWLLPLGVRAAPALQADPPPNDNFADAVTIEALPFTAEIESIGGATVEENEPRNCFSDVVNYQTVWYKITLSADASAQLRITSSSELVWTLYTGTALEALEMHGCNIVYQSYPPAFLIPVAEGMTYYLRIGSLSGMGGSLNLVLEPAPPPLAGIYFSPAQPSTFDMVSFYNTTWDPLGTPIQTTSWDFGDGATGAGSYAVHQYRSEGSYTVTMTATTYDGRSATAVQVVVVENHDVAITKLSAPTAAREGQSRQVSVGINSKLRDETVTVVIYKSAVGAPDGFQEVGRLTQVVPVRPANRTTAFDFSYTFTSADAAVGKVTFKTVAIIEGLKDALPADNTAIALPTKVSGSQTQPALDAPGVLYLPMVAGRA